MSARLNHQQLNAVAGLFQVLSEPSRLAMLQALAAGPLNVSELMHMTGTKQANASKQLTILYRAGLLARERQGNEIVYEVADPLVYQLCELVCGKLQRDAEKQYKELSPKRR